MYNPKEDELFQNPYKDIEEDRTRNGLEYYYVHGGFEGTKVKFSFCFPKKEVYAGRFYQFLSPFPGPDEEMASLTEERTGMEDHVYFALTHGAYFVESNMGSDAAFGPSTDPTILYRSSAAVAEYSREVAAQLYNCKRPYGYVYGGSGGGYKTCGCIENTTAFDGAVPFVTACPVALPNIMTVTAHARRILRHKLDWITDALEAGSTHDILSGLNEEEQEAFLEVSRMGVPHEAWIGMKNADDGGFAVIAPAARAMDPGYFEDFWSKEGYLGADSDSTACRDRISMQANVRTVILPKQREIRKRQIQGGMNGVDAAWQKMIMEKESDDISGIEIEELLPIDQTYLKGLKVTFLSGEAQGTTLPLSAVSEHKLVFDTGYGAGTLEEVLSKVKQGDCIYVDNADYIAIQTYHRHQVPGEEFKVWDQFRREDKSPKLPQRESLMCTGFAYQGAGSIQSGDIQGNVIMVNCLADGGACTWMSDWYKHKVMDKYGEDTDRHFRLWCLEHCGHSDLESTADPFHIPSYLGVLYRALLAVAEWTERGVEPPLNSVYTIVDGQPAIPVSAAERKGIQPVADLRANGEKRCEVSAGQSVSFKLEVQVPEHNSFVREIEWSFEGEAYAQGKMEMKHTYQLPGEYFAVARVKVNSSQDVFTEIQNLDRVRVVVR